MPNRTSLKIFTASLLVGASAFAAQAETFNIPGGDLKAALDQYARQTGAALVYSDEALGKTHTQGAKGDISSTDALSRILSGTGFTAQHYSAGGIGIVPASGAKINAGASLQSDFQLAQATPSKAAVETVTVTSSKLGGADVQSIPIAITALSQEQLTATQTAGGPDLVKQVPNLTFSKTNFTGYNIQIRGIGTQAISVTTDPAVAVALNDIPFLRNHFFEQEFYDLAQAEVLRGPQGTLYGRNATAGVVNLTTARPTDQFEAMASAEIGSYHQKRFEGMINLPIVDDRVDLRIAGEWTKRQGYSFNDLTQQRIDGRDLWSGRVSLGLKPVERLQINAMWEHFSEDDDRMRTAKQLCKTAPIPHDINGQVVDNGFYGIAAYQPDHYLSQGCLPTSLYSPEAFEVPNGISLPYYSPLSGIGVPVNASIHFDPYSGTTQSTNLRVIETALNPIYKAKNDTVELNADYTLSPELTFTSQSGFNNDFLWSTEDYNRFNTRSGAFEAGGFLNSTSPLDPNDGICTEVYGSCTALYQPCTGAGVAGRFSGGAEATCMGVGTFCDPQLGCSDRLVAQDLSTEHSWQFSQEFRLASHYSGPLNFSVGGNYLHYETEENYYVFINSLTLASYTWNRGGSMQQTLPWVPGVSDNTNCLVGGLGQSNPFGKLQIGVEGELPCQYIDPNDLEHLNNKGHNYFLSQNPYTLNSYAGFGEVYYNVLDDVKLIGGLRFTEDQKHFTDIPSELLIPGYGYAVTGVLNQQWDQFTGRAAVNWTPKLNFTDQTLVYGSYAHGYKAGGANPPGAVLLTYNDIVGNGEISNPIHPLAFKPEFVDAFELGTKNTLLDGALTFNMSAFYYNYENYQISRIVDRTSINDNFDAHVKGAEIESSWEPAPGLRFNFAGGWEDTALAKGSKSVDLMDRTDAANHPDWIVVKPFVTQTSNCILPKYVVAASLEYGGSQAPGAGTSNVMLICGKTYGAQLDPITAQPYTPVQNPAFPDYPGFNPLQPGINNGEGFDKDLSGNELPNAPPFTVSAGAQYTIPLSSDWAGTLRADYYWQDYSWARIFNDNPYDRLRGYTNVNLTLILTSQAGWQVMLYDKNIFNTTAITGDFLNSDDSGLTTNVFLTDPKLIGIRVTKNW